MSEKWVEKKWSKEDIKGIVNETVGPGIVLVITLYAVLIVTSIWYLNKQHVELKDEVKVLREQLEKGK